MQSFQLSSHINPQGVLQIQLPKSLANQDVEIILVVQTKTTAVVDSISDIPQNKCTAPQASFAALLIQFLQEVESDPIDIDTAMFDNYRKSTTNREFTWEG